MSQGVNYHFKWLVNLVISDSFEVICRPTKNIFDEERAGYSHKGQSTSSTEYELSEQNQGAKIQFHGERQTN